MTVVGGERVVAYRQLVGDLRPVTLERARAARVNGWNLSCQRCSNFGVRWIPSALRRSVNLRLCPECEHDHANARRALADLELVVFSDRGERRR